MTIFDLHTAALEDYSACVRSFIHIADDDIREYVHQQVDDGHI